MGHVKIMCDKCVGYSKQQVKISVLLEINIWHVYFCSVFSFIIINYSSVAPSFWLLTWEHLLVKILLV